MQQRRLAETYAKRIVDIAIEKLQKNALTVDDQTGFFSSIIGLKVPDLEGASFYEHPVLTELYVDEPPFYNSFGDRGSRIQPDLM